MAGPSGAVQKFDGAPNGAAQSPPPFHLTEADLEAVIGHPAFAEALRESAGVMVRHYRNLPVLNAIINDRGRLVISSFAAYLNERPPAAPNGLTASRLKAICVNHGVCSAGRATAMIALMRWGGFLESMGRTADGSQQLKPTRRLIASHTDRWKRQLPLTARVFPAVGAIGAPIDHPAFVRGFILAQGDAYLSGFRLAETAPTTRLFLDRVGGWIMLMSLVTRGGPGPHPFSASALSRMVHASRPHVTGLFRDAQTAGLVTRSPAGDSVTLLPPLLDGVNRFIAAAFHLNAHCARAGEAEWRRSTAGRR